MNISEASAKRAMRRAGIHLLRAAIEGVKAVEVILEELSSDVDDEDEDRGPKPQRIEVE